jgi:hypothetical protein
VAIRMPLGFFDGLWSELHFQNGNTAFHRGRARYKGGFRVGRGG